MRLLLDTCTFLWFLTRDRALPEACRKQIMDGDCEVVLSVISIWEAIIKQLAGRLSLPAPAGEYLVGQRERHGISSLELSESSLPFLAKLPNHHRDPFDRILICQAMDIGAVILTPDRAIRQYPVKTYWEHG
ncbi:MAG: type II toxin-antitoxin system VapC family toxin [Deltaproteobacteria bacterium]|nr:type II toxin-antitoxin system VapC family toxin [Deltaproteobacteria bacterium]